MKVIRQSELTTTQSDLIDTIRGQIKYKHLLEIVSIGAIEVGGQKVLLKDRGTAPTLLGLILLGKLPNGLLETC